MHEEWVSFFCERLKVIVHEIKKKLKERKVGKK
jgi:hypothetical protein